MTGEVVPLTPFLSLLLVSSVFGDFINHARLMTNVKGSRIQYFLRI